MNLEDGGGCGPRFAVCNRLAPAVWRSRERAGIARSRDGVSRFANAAVTRLSRNDGAFRPILSERARQNGLFCRVCSGYPP